MPHDALSTVPNSQARPAFDRYPGSEIRDITDRAASSPAFQGHEQVLEITDDEVGLTAIIGIHDRTFGPALGGCRIVDYSSWDAALTDVLRLSHAMTYKAALAGLELGGGKSVLLPDANARLDETFFRRFGKVIRDLGGRYITGEDSGTSVREMDWIAKETDHVIGTSARGGDPSLMTATGVFEGIRESLNARFGSTDLSGISVAVQGLGHVGANLCKKLARAGARLFVSDIDAARVKNIVDEFDAVPVAPDDICRMPVDVFAPCALGGVLNAATIPMLACAVVAGSANNQLATVEDGEALYRRGILYAPDYVANAGGLISAAMGLAGNDPNGAATEAKVIGIGHTLAEIYRRSRAENLAPAVVADRIAEERLDSARAAKQAG